MALECVRVHQARAVHGIGKRCRGDEVFHTLAEPLPQQSLEAECAGGHKAGGREGSIEGINETKVNFALVVGRRFGDAGVVALVKVDLGAQAGQLKRNASPLETRTQHRNPA